MDEMSMRLAALQTLSIADGSSMGILQFHR